MWIQGRVKRPVKLGGNAAKSRLGSFAVLAFKKSVRRHHLALVKNTPFGIGALAATLLLILLPKPLAHAEPAVSIRKALDLAEEALAAKGKKGEVYIESITWDRSSILSPKGVWVVSWSATIPGSKPGSKEVGIEINMQGEVLHLVNARGKKKNTSPH